MELTLQLKLQGKMWKLYQAVRQLTNLTVTIYNVMNASDYQQMETKNMSFI